ncbi:hypothetical protein FDC50_12895 [Clostridium botulinum]|uniref:Uncharacterized protein n=1 Tax=Clostridium botulinum TaxID=1491 RepID=A0A093VUQ8_CLOBO|nr:hypothetical protein [Clostridium botulinum]AIW54658.1 hypothetical protein [Clostridium botulinum]AIW54907.1 hypothetical protein [Clostridium botulinum]AIW54962.1 hypothetical protein [Clostridium botulinum]AIW55016.1 hypothetical protein [Clostridium botulinum]KFX53744.1 hypothetical protein KU40_19280 [Clostridium botulinum]
MDVINQLVQLGNEVVKWIQTLGVPSCAIALAVGGIQQIWGGTEGGRKARPWYTGAGLGLLVILGASAIAAFLSTKITF